MLLRMIFASVAILFGVWGPAHAGKNPPKCDSEICRGYREATPRSPIPTSIRRFCFYFEQPAPDAVSILVVDKDGRRINADNKRHSKEVRSTSGKFCIGFHYLERAEQVILCNGVAHAVIDKAGLGWLTEWNRKHDFDPWRTPPDAPVRIFPSGKVDPDWKRLQIDLELLRE